MTNRRDFFRKGLSEIYLPFYDALCDCLGPEWQPYSAARSFVQQDALWSQGRTLPGSVVTNAKAGESAHCWGCGSDWTVFLGDTPQWLNKSDAKWDDYKSAVEKAGLRWGGEFGDVDHNELRITCRWHDILDVYNARGMYDAMLFLKGKLT